MAKTRDRVLWRTLGEAYVQQWTADDDDDDDDADDDDDDDIILIWSFYPNGDQLIYKCF